MRLVTGWLRCETFKHQDGFVPLWGIVRDLGSTQRFRPTGLALTMLNHAVQGDVYQVSNQETILIAHRLHLTAFGSSSQAGQSPQYRSQQSRGR